LGALRGGNLDGGCAGGGYIHGFPVSP